MREKKILLSLMPFWAPLSPPLGISLLKSYVQQYNNEVVIHDFNTDDILWEILDRYFKVLREAVPGNKQGNFYMLAFDVLSNHLMIYIHKNLTLESKYDELVRILVKKNYFVEIEKNAVVTLDKIISEFYHLLRKILVEVYSKEKPGICGISVFSTSLGPSLFAFKLIKEEFPDIKTVMGGGVFADHLAIDSPNFNDFLDKTESYIDNIIVGEGEILFQEYLSGNIDTSHRVISLKDIGDKNMDLTLAPFPDFSGLKLSSYSQMAVYATRSCPFQCGFCSETIQWGKFRKKTAEQVVNEISSVKKKYGGKLFMFGDSLMNQVISEFSHQLLKKGLDIFWDGYLRTDHNVTEISNIQLWKKAGFYRARLGVESGSQHVLDLMNKKMTVDRIKTAIKNLANSGIKTTTYWVIGYPGETETDFNGTLELLSELKDDIYEADWHPFYFYPKGQVHSDNWIQENDVESLYPEKFKDLLLTLTWILKKEPGREELYDRMNRFGETCKKLNIPNPYSMMEIYNADKRWKQLHPTAGPTILELHNSRYLI